MAIFLASWRVVHPHRSVPDGYASIEEFVQVSNSADVGIVFLRTTQSVREKLRTNADFRKTLGIDGIPEPGLFNIIFQPPLTKIDV